MVAFTLHSACASLCDIFNVGAENLKLLIRQLRSHALQKHLQSSGQVYHVAKSHTQTLMGPANEVGGCIVKNIVVDVYSKTELASA